jgi:chromosome segregation ATPase
MHMSPEVQACCRQAYAANHKLLLYWHADEVPCCLCMQGTVSRKGSMSGGWAGSSGSYAETYWANKHRRDESAQQLSACVQQLRAAETTVQQLQQQRMSAEVQLAAAQHQQQLLHELHDAQAQVAAAAAALQQEQQLMRELEERSAGLQQRLLQYQAALGPHLTGSSAGHGMAGRRGSQGSAAGRAASAVLVQQLQEEAREAAAAVKAAEQQLEEAQQQVGCLRCIMWCL